MEPWGTLGCKGYKSLIFRLFYEGNYTSTQLTSVLDPSWLAGSASSELGNTERKKRS